MHASNIALLVLAASAAVPALSVPLSTRNTAGVPVTGDVIASDSTVDPADLQVLQNLMTSRPGDGNAIANLERPTHDNELVGRTVGPFLRLIALLRRLRGRVPILGREDAEDPVEKIMQNLGLSDADLEQMMMMQTRDGELLAQGGGPIPRIIALIQRLRGKFLGSVPGLGREDAGGPIEELMQSLGLSDADLEQMMMMQTRDDELLAQGGGPIPRIIALIHRLRGKLLGTVPVLGRDDDMDALLRALQDPLLTRDVASGAMVPDDMSDLITALLQSREVTPEQLIALDPRSFDDLD